MKAAIINTVCGYGSTGRICINIAEALHAGGHEARIYYGRGTADGANAEYARKIGSSAGILLHVLRTRVFDDAGFGSASATRHLIHDLEAFDPDIVHLHNLHGYYVNIGILFEYLKQSGKQVIWTLHDCWSFTGHCAHFDYIGCQKWKVQCHSCPQKRIFPTSCLLDRSSVNFEKKRELFNSIKNLTLVTPSKWLEGKVKESFLSNVPVHVVNNGIDLEQFQPLSSGFREKFNLRDKSIILGVAIGWDDRKGLKHFFEVARMLDSRFQVVLVGLTKKQSRMMPENVLSLPRTGSRRELAELYSTADMFVNPTMQEVLGLVNLEALACGTPVITFDTGGSPECVDSSCGIVVQKGNTAEMVKAIKYLDSHRPDLAACRKRASLFEKNEKAREYIDLYTERLAPVGSHRNPSMQRKQNPVNERTGI